MHEVVDVLEHWWLVGSGAVLLTRLEDMMNALSPLLFVLRQSSRFVNGVLYPSSLGILLRPEYGENENESRSKKVVRLYYSAL